MSAREGRGMERLSCLPRIHSSRVTCPLQHGDNSSPIRKAKLSFKRAGFLQSRDVPHPTADTGIGWPEFWKEEA